MLISADRWKNCRGRASRKLTAGQTLLLSMGKKIEAGSLFFRRNGKDRTAGNQEGGPARESQWEKENQ